MSIKHIGIVNKGGPEPRLMLRSSVGGGMMRSGQPARPDQRVLGVYADGGMLVLGLLPLDGPIRSF
ncbi:hypothetical protein [Paenibacillus sp. y28]|uniref:hypothetical protein n=1 Tax=Paenibacillus sp. y28 TaxID=3129110 RepID=UPI00301B4E8E